MKMIFVPLMWTFMFVYVISRGLLLVSLHCCGSRPLLLEIRKTAQHRQSRR